MVQAALVRDRQVSFSLAINLADFATVQGDSSVPGGSCEDYARICITNAFDLHC